MTQGNGSNGAGVRPNRKQRRHPRRTERRPQKVGRLMAELLRRVEFSR